MKVIGYFVDRGGSLDNIVNLFVAIDDGQEDKITIYSPVGQHQEGSRDYLEECTKITRKQYIKRTEHLYTPVEYLIIK